MAKCEEGYLCAVCGGDVESIAESDLYLRFVVGLIDPEVLHVSSEKHLRCNPTLAQFIVDPGFKPVFVEGPFDKRVLDVDFVQARETLISRGWRRLCELASQPQIPILEYPLPEVIARLKASPRVSE
jgi:hypothetical protein